MYVQDVGLVQRLADAVVVEEKEVKSSPIEDSDEGDEDGGGKMTAGLTTAEGAAPIPYPW